MATVSITVPSTAAGSKGAKEPRCKLGALSCEAGLVLCCCFELFAFLMLQNLAADNSFTQQDLAACRPLLTPSWVSFVWVQGHHCMQPPHCLQTLTCSRLAGDWGIVGFRGCLHTDWRGVFDGGFVGTPLSGIFAVFCKRAPCAQTGCNTPGERVVLHR